jgi:GntR family transcriptional regulator, transcriptional repressor for pyruvate dehydrogenase complex
VARSSTISTKRRETAASPKSPAPASRSPAEPGFRRVQVARASEDIARQIRDELSGGRLRPGDRLPAERELAVQFGVARNTLREALRSLEIAGLIVLRKGAAGGAFVKDSNGETIVTGISDMFSLGAVTAEQITEARIWVETAVVRAACAQHTPADIDKLRANLETVVEAMRRNDFYARAEAHLEFHMILSRIARNPIMETVMEALLGVVRGFIHSIGPQQINEYVLPSRRRFMVHFEARDADAAVEEMERHLKRVNRNYLARLGERTKARAG